MIDQRDMIDAPRDGTQILAHLAPDTIELRTRGRPPRTVVRPGHFVLVRWFEALPGQGYWSCHHKGQGKLRGELLAWWPLPARGAA